MKVKDKQVRLLPHAGVCFLCTQTQISAIEIFKY